MTDKVLKLRDQFSANVNAKDGSVYTIGFGGDLVAPITGQPIDLADGELERLTGLGAFDEPDAADGERLLRTVAGVANQPSPELAYGTAPEAESPQEGEPPVDEESKPARSRRS